VYWVFIGQMSKIIDLNLTDLILPYWPLFPAVLIGGQIGSFMASKGLKQNWIKRLTAMLILYVALRLLWSWARIVF